MNIPDKEKFIYEGRCGFTASNSTLKNGTTLTIEAPVKIVNSRIVGNTYIGAFTNIRDNCLLRSVTSIGRFTSVAGGVVMWNANHASQIITTHVIVENADSEWLSDWTKIPNSIDWIRRNKEVISGMKNSGKKRTIIVGNDCWIGNGVKILQGVTIGDGAIIGAGAIVTRDVPPYAVAVGNPAKVVKYRFSDNIIAKLMALKWWNYGPDILLDSNLEDIEETIDLITSRIKKGFPLYKSDFWKINRKGEILCNHI